MQTIHLDIGALVVVGFAQVNSNNDRCGSIIQTCDTHLCPDAIPPRSALGLCILTKRRSAVDTCMLRACMFGS